MTTKYIKGQSGNPAGRPKGIKNKATLLRASLEDDLPDLLAVVKKQALEGDIQAIKLILDRVMPPLKATAPVIELLELSKATTLSEKAEAIIDAVGCGELAPDIASQLISAVATLAKVIEIDQLQQRLEALEQHLIVKER